MTTMLKTEWMICDSKNTCVLESYKLAIGSMCVGNVRMTYMNEGEWEGYTLFEYELDEATDTEEFDMKVEELQSDLMAMEEFV